jgi:hypothetical protein
MPTDRLLTPEPLAVAGMCVQALLTSFKQPTILLGWLHFN